MDPALAAKVLRFSTRGVAGENASTPAIDAAATAPTFDATEGLFFYGANFNLTLGSLYQPLVIGVADDNRNLNMEITRILIRPMSIRKFILIILTQLRPLIWGRLVMFTNVAVP